MCSTVIFQYRCNCTESVIFECPFSVKDESSSKPKRPHPYRFARPRACPRRYRRHQQKLLEISITPTHPQPTQFLATKMPQGTTLKTSAAHATVKPSQTSQITQMKTSITKLDEQCHDCWHRDMHRAKGIDDDVTFPSTTRGKEGQRPDPSRILRERSVNEFTVPLLPLDEDETSSTEEGTPEERG